MRALIVGLLVLFFFTLPSPVSADVAPPAQPPGTNPLPGSEQTQVRMASEIVIINILSNSPEKSRGQARVSADFTMYNTGSTAETMAVRFPVGSDDGWGNVPEIKQFQVKVDGRVVTLRRVMAEDPQGSQEQTPWVEFDVTFPPQKEVKIVVTYLLEATGEMPYVWFNYIFSTGAGWVDTIGSAQLVVNFPYDVDELFILACIDSDYGCTTRGGTVSGRSITWEYADFEPQPEDNFQLSIVSPSVWKQVLAERQQVLQTPNDGEAWGRLGKLYKSLLFNPHGRRGFRNWTLMNDPGAQHLFELSDEAYGKAVALKPNDAQWHAGYADLLGLYAFYAGFEGVENIPIFIQALEEINTALQIAPNDQVVQDIASELSFYISEGMVENNDGYDFPWLTQTPVPTATEIIPVLPATTTPTPQAGSTEQPAVITRTAIATVTMTPVLVPLETDAPESRNKLPICGGAAMIPVILAGGIAFSRSKRGVIIP